MAPSTGERVALGLARALFDGLEALLAVSPLPLEVALSSASQVGRARARFSGRWPSAAEVAALFGTGPLASRRLALAVAAAEARNRLVVRRSQGRSLARFAPLVEWRDAAAAAGLQPPLVLVTAHIGALYLLAAGFDQLGLHRTVLRWSPIHEPAPGERLVATAGGLVGRTHALLRGVEALRRGEFVVTALEGEHGAGESVNVLGRPLQLGRGAFALARQRGVRVVPVAALWRGNRVVCELGSPVAGPADAGRWLEALLRREPEQISLGLLRQLLLGPALGAPGEDALRR
ncbi:MAG: hypothetical protein ABI689_12700 [Thermoanaerobaculia bacterium]